MKNLNVSAISALKNNSNLKPIHVEHSNQLQPGEWYILRTKPQKLVGGGYTQPSYQFSQCRQYEGNWMMFENRIWAHEDNPQAFKTWDIFGPVAPNEIMTALVDSIEGDG